MDLEIRIFEEELITFINNSPLPIEIKRLCLLEIYKQTELTAQQVINRQSQEQEQKKEQVVMSE